MFKVDEFLIRKVSINMSLYIFSLQVKGVVQHFYERDNRMLLIGRKHMLRWPNFLNTLQEFNVHSFFIDNL